MIDISYSKDIQSVTLSFEPLRNDMRATGPEKLVLKWPANRKRVEVRMGNDTKDEVPQLDTPQRCDTPRDTTGPLLKPRDNDFDLHYNLLDIPADVERVLPQNDPHQTRFDGCVPGTT
jgi:hypothetical protein